MAENEQTFTVDVSSTIMYAAFVVTLDIRRDVSSPAWTHEEERSSSTITFTGS